MLAGQGNVLTTVVRVLLLRSVKVKTICVVILMC